MRAAAADIGSSTLESAERSGLGAKQSQSIQPMDGQSERQNEHVPELLVVEHCEAGLERLWPVFGVLGGIAKLLGGGSKWKTFLARAPSRGCHWNVQRWFRVGVDRGAVHVATSWVGRWMHVGDGRSMKRGEDEGERTQREKRRGT